MSGTAPRAKDRIAELSQLIERVTERGARIDDPSYADLLPDVLVQPSKRRRYRGK